MPLPLPQPLLLLLQLRPPLLLSDNNECECNADVLEQLLWNLALTTSAFSTSDDMWPMYIYTCGLCFVKAILCRRGQ